ncbi:MAG: TRAP transporter large permease [Treponema sp.]|jgi:tripartite ATP-independent transporter DctM subunit|nr:TRAP transporter large permease [Treponema sp.]
MILVFVVTLIIGVPIAFSLGLTALIGLHDLGPAFLLAVPQKLFATSNNYSLMAIPLFIMAGELMGLSGDINRLMDFARVLIGRVRGGLCYVSIVVGVMIGGLLGMANAAAALLSTTIYPEMIKDGYEENFSAPFVASVSIIAPMIPPGMLFVIYCVASNTSIADLFMAGLPTGIMIAIVLTLVISFAGRKYKWPVSTQSASLKEVLVKGKRAGFSVLAPFITAISIGAGIATPTEAAAVVCVLVFLVGFFVYKKITLRDMTTVLIRTGTISGAILIISAMGGVLGWHLSIAHIPQTIARGISMISNNPLVITMIIQLFLFFVGMVMDSAPAVMILVPVFMPVVQQFGFDPVHFGLLMCLNLSIGLLTPPVGTVLYTTAMATGVPTDRMIRHIWPWVGALSVVLMVIAYVPDSVMWLPRLLSR